MLRFLRLLGVTMALTVQVAACQTADLHFANRACRLAFSYPADWEVVSDTVGSDTPCSFSLRPRAWQQLLLAHDSVDLYSILLRGYPNEVWSQASQNGFEHHDSGWVALGWQGAEAPADTVHGPGWHGVRGMPTAGCYKVQGPYFGLCDTPTAVVGTRTWAVVLVGGPQSEDVFDRVLATLRLGP